MRNRTASATVTRGLSCANPKRSTPKPGCLGAKGSKGAARKDRGTEITPQITAKNRGSFALTGSGSPNPAKKRAGSKSTPRTTSTKLSLGREVSNPRPAPRRCSRSKAPLFVEQASGFAPSVTGACFPAGIGPPCSYLKPEASKRTR